MLAGVEKARDAGCTYVYERKMEKGQKEVGMRGDVEEKESIDLVPWELLGKVCVGWISIVIMLAGDF